MFGQDLVTVERWEVLVKSWSQAKKTTSWSQTGHREDPNENIGQVLITAGIGRGMVTQGDLLTL